MTPEESLACDLAAQLRSHQLPASEGGAGHTWGVEAGPVDGRSASVSCFLCPEVGPRNSADPARRPTWGPEFLVRLSPRVEGHILEGRTRQIAEAVAALRAWLGGSSLAQLAEEAPFVDRRGRAIRALTRSLDRGLRWHIDGDPTHEMWVYGGDRSCKVVERDGHVSVTALLGQAEVARATGLAGLEAVSAWLREGTSLDALASRGVELTPHARLLEVDPARWHWLCLLDALDEGDDTLEPLRPLLKALALSPVATRFYTFTSHSSLCFSASSHYPWVSPGLPVVAPAGGGSYRLGRELHPTAGAVRRIEAQLVMCPVEPFVGSASHHLLPLLREALARQGSAIQPRLEQSRAWYSLLAGEPPRQCRISGRDVWFSGERARAISWPTLDEVAHALHRHIVEGASYEELAASPRAKPWPPLAR